MQISNNASLRESSGASTNKVQVEKDLGQESKDDSINITDIFVAREESEKLEANLETSENKVESESLLDPNEKSFYEKLHDEKTDNIFKYMQMASRSRFSDTNDPSQAEYGSEAYFSNFEAI
jgi:hypothetical protein